MGAVAQVGSYLPFNPIKGQAFRLFIPSTEVDQLPPNTESFQSSISKDAGTFVATTNVLQVIQPIIQVVLIERDQIYIDLTTSEMNADTIIVVFGNTGQVQLKQAICIYTNPSVAGGSPFATPPVQPSTGQDISSTVMSFIISAGEKGYFISKQAKNESGFNYYGLEGSGKNRWYVIIQEPIGGGTIGYYMDRENRNKFKTSFTNRAILNYKSRPPVL